MSYSISSFFAPIDSGFLNVDINSEPLLWQTTDYLVQSVFELPIPTTAGAVIRFSFSTKQGDISFGARLLSHGHPVEIVTENCRIPSDIEVISGSYKCPRDGALVLIFDNSFSWFTPKLLSYKVELSPPQFSLIDSARSNKCKSLLSVIVSDTRKSELVLLKTAEKIKTLTHDISSLEERISFIMADLDEKKFHMNGILDECEGLAERIALNKSKQAGLCIRCLDRHSLALVLSFLGGVHSPAASVNKFWYLCSKAPFTPICTVSIPPADAAAVGAVEGHQAPGANEDVHGRGKEGGVSHS